MPPSLLGGASLNGRVSDTDPLGLEVFGLYLGFVVDEEECRGVNALMNRWALSERSELARPPAASVRRI
jgi:hypothetical protein